jgi:hypothetical protein
VKSYSAVTAKTGLDAPEAHADIGLGIRADQSAMTCKKREILLHLHWFELHFEKSSIVRLILFHWDPEAK